MRIKLTKEGSQGFSGLEELVGRDALGSSINGGIGERSLDSVEPGSHFDRCVSMNETESWKRKDHEKINNELGL